ncbi:MAG: hypothetical protein A2X86_15055 [Bdellovibrionales bacterium GWA2_49_15]|nr:MAG: hypothetical protein A2X86_15055 [Bdellovibrionales bacterium GWA2_49_15]HAZ13338.1 hypothetical protein [Bdellovibrionales bacterium]
MSSTDDKDKKDSDEHHDLTRLEDLSEFLHEIDPKTEEILAKNNTKDSPKKGTSAAATLDDLEEEHEITLDEAVAAVEAKPSEAVEDEETVEEKAAPEVVSEPPEMPADDEISLDAVEEHEEEHDTAEFQIPVEETPVAEQTAEEELTVDDDLEIAEDTPIEEVSEQTPPAEESEIQIEDISADNHQASENAPEIVPKENFQDVRDFAESMTFGQVGQGGNPPYSIILRNIQYKEDAEEIKRVLKEHGLLTESSQKEIEQGLLNGSILLSQLAEYPAIFLAHAFRRFDLTLEMGLSAELHHSKNYKDENYRGLVSKHSLYQNYDGHVDLVGGPVSIDQIILSTLSTLENYKIHRYLDVASESVLVDESTFHTSHKQAPAKSSGSKKKHIDIFDLDFASPTLAEIYKDLAQKLRLQAKELKGNAVVGINYQITPLTTTLSSARGGDDGLTNAYRITCTGNVVWLSHLQTAP